MYGGKLVSGYGSTGDFFPIDFDISLKSAFHLFGKFLIYA